MNILMLLIPFSVALVAFIIGVLFWAVYTGQFDDLENHGQSILNDQE